VEAAAVAEAKRKEEEAEAARKAEEEAEAARKKEEEEEATRKVAEEEAAALRKDDEPVSGTDALASTKSELPLTASDDKDEAMTVEPKPEELAQTGQEDNSIAGIPVSNDSQDQPTNVGSASGSTETDAITETPENRTTHEGQDMDQEMADVTPAIEQPAAPATENSDEVEPQPPAPGASTEHQRVTIMIHGNPVDITDTGIDLDFLEALPDEMREEVVNQHVSAQRAARVTRPADSQISTEFLDALPPEIRAEIIQQETLERASRAPPAPVAAPGGAAAVLPTAMAADIDPASFIASLDPQLRQVIMMEQDDGFIQSLPPHMLAEANAFREARRHHVPRDRAPQTPPAGRKPASARDSIQLVDKTGISVLVRLLFFPHALRKSLLLKALLNLCENGKTRTELLTLLTNILQDGTGDVAAIDKSFAQLSFGNVKSPGPMTPMTPKAIGKQRAIDSLTALALPSHEAVPELVAQRSLEALSYVVSHNDRSAVFFLTQHEMSSSLKRSLSKKGKGKEKQATTHYPIVSLLGLLDRRAFLKTTSITEGVVGLLAVVTRPLSTMPPVKDKLETVPATSSSTDSAQASTSVEPTTVPTADASQRKSRLDSCGAAADNLPVASVTVPVDAENKEQPPEAKTEEETKGLITAPPQIPASVLRLVVNILTMGECSGRTFQNTLALIQHLSAIPETREIIAQELREKAQESGHSIQEELYELATALNDSTTDVLVNSAMTKFSLASSEQAKLLRILKTLDYMFTHKSSSADKSSETNIDQVQGIYESFNFAPLWARLGSCLTVIEEHTELEHVATVLLPLIEALMVVCKHVGVASSTGTRTILPGSSPRAPTTPRESMEDLFVAFTDSHRKILNLMVRNNPSLMSGSFSLLVHNPRVLDFDNKRNYFNQQLRRRTPSRDHHGTLQVNVRRARVFEESFQSLQRKTAEQMKYGKLSVRFYDEEGVDAGGLTREWFQILARQMFDPNYALFQPCVADKLTYQPNQASWVNPEHLSFFKFVGRVIGKAIFDGRLLDAYFARSFYRQLLGKTTDYRDVEWVDPEYYNSLCWILENDPEVLDMNFSVEADEVRR
jgi:E3 ubiquitin-protein ligase HUWE1